MGVAVPTGSWKLDLDTLELELCNLSRDMLGLPIGDARPLPRGEWVHRIHPDDLGSVMEQLWISAENPKQPFSHCFRSVQPNGSFREILGVGNAVYKGQERAAMLIGSNIDLLAAANLVEVTAAAQASPDRKGDPSPLAANENFSRGSAVSNRGHADSDLAEVDRPRGDHAIAVSELLRKRARAILKVRRARLGFFADAMIGEPAFDILLVMYAAGTAGQPFSLNLVAGSLGLTASQAQRWLAYLHEQGLVVFARTDVPQKGANPWITPEGCRSIEAFLEFVVSNSASGDDA